MGNSRRSVSTWPLAGDRVFGRVLDSVTHEPVAGAIVALLEIGPDSGAVLGGSAGGSRGARTRSDGTFSIIEVPRGVYRLRVKSIGYEVHESSVSVVGDLHLSIFLRVAALAGPDVIVEGKTERPESSVSVLGSHELEQRRGQTLGETLREIPGVAILQTGPSVSKPVLRGLHSQRLAVLVGGVEQEGQQWGAEHAPEVDPYSAGRIEVINGAEGVEYGVGAMGGVIKIESRELPYDGEFGGNLSLNLFSNNWQGSGSLILEDRLLVEGLAGRLQLSARKAGDARAPDYVLGNTAFSELNGSAAVGYKLGSTVFEATMSHFGSDLGILSASHVGNLTDLERALSSDRPLTNDTFGYDIQGPRQAIAHEMFAFSASSVIPGLGKLNGRYAFQNNARQEFDAHSARGGTIPAGGERPMIDLMLQAHSIGLKLQHEAIGKIFGSAGMDLSRQGNISSGRERLIPNYRSYGAGLYVLEHYLIEGDNAHGSAPADWDFTLGARLDVRSLQAFGVMPDSSVDPLYRYTNVSGSFGAEHHFSEDWAASASIRTAWRPPGVSELYTRGVHHGSAQYEIGHADLGIERSATLDLTLHYTTASTRGEVSLYRNQMNGFIYTAPLPEPTLTVRGAYPTFEYRQTDAVLSGVEVSIEHQFTDAFRFVINASALRGTDIVHNEPLIYMPQDRLHTVGHLDLPQFSSLLSESHAEIAATFVRRQDRVPNAHDYAPPPPGFATLDAELGSRIAVGLPLRLTLSVENLLNTSYRDYLSRYRYFADNPGRNIVLRLQMTFGHFELH